MSAGLCATDVEFTTKSNLCPLYYENSLTEALHFHLSQSKLLNQYLSLLAGLEESTQRNKDKPST